MLKSRIKKDTFITDKLIWDKNSITLYVHNNLDYSNCFEAFLIERNKKREKIKANYVKKVDEGNIKYYIIKFDIDGRVLLDKEIYDAFIYVNKSEVRIKSGIVGCSENIPFRVGNEAKAIEAYSTIYGNLSFKVIKAKAILECINVKVENNILEIEGDVYTLDKIEKVRAYIDEDSTLLNGKIESEAIVNNYMFSKYKFEISMYTLLDYEKNNLSNDILIWIEIIDKSGMKEKYPIKPNKRFMERDIIINEKEVKCFIDSNDNLRLRVHDSNDKARVTHVYSHIDRFEVLGFIESKSYKNYQGCKAKLKSRKDNREFQVDTFWENEKFKINIQLDNLVKYGLKEGIFDLYIISETGNEMKIQSLNDGILNKQKVVNIPQQMFSDESNTYVYKVYYTLENELALLVRNYMNLANFTQSMIVGKKLILKGNFFVEPPKQVLPENIDGTMNFKGFYNRIYNLECKIKTNSTIKKYYTKFELEADLTNINIEELKNDIFYAILNLKIEIDGNLINMFRSVEPKTYIDGNKIWEKQIKGKYKKVSEAFYKVCNKILPINDKIAIFQSFHGKSYSCNPKAIYEQLLKNNSDIKGVYVLDNIFTDVPNNTIIIRPNTLKYYYYMARGKYFINNGNFPDFYEKRKGTIHLQTWHGTPLKKLGLDISKESPSYAENVSPELIRRNSRWDYLIGPNEYTSNILQRAYNFKKEMLNVGYPRNDVLYSIESDEKAKSIKKKLGIDFNKKVVLYAPTWRDSDFHGINARQPYKLKFDIDEFKRRFGGTHVLIVRLHYRDASRLGIDIKDNCIINASFYDDIQELYLISDILITDYSSVMFDYANLKRNTIFYCYDYLKYKSEIRGVYLNFAAIAPGPIVFEEEQLFQAIENIDSIHNQYIEKIENFYNEYCSWEDGGASNRVIDRIFKEN